MPPPASVPIGFQVASTAKALNRGFEDALNTAGGSLPVWLVLLSLKAGQHNKQGDLAEAIGVEGPTLTHHLNRMEADGLVIRARDPQNRRIHRVELTTEGEAMFDRLRAAASRFDRRLRQGLSDDDISRLASLLGALRSNVKGDRP
jgi:MarR family transcriptional regulator for hemolysin